MTLTETSRPSREWRRLARAMSSLHAQDRAILVNVVRQLAAIEAEQGPDVAEATLERLILRLSGGERDGVM